MAGSRNSINRSGQQLSTRNSASSPYANILSTSKIDGLSTSSNAVASPYSNGSEKLSEERKPVDFSESSSQSEELPRNIGRRAPKLLEAKWRISALRSPMCEGCGPSVCPPVGYGSKSWKCGPCVRALEASYLRALEHMEQEYEIKLQKNLAIGVRNFQLQEEMHKRGNDIERLSLLLHEAESKLSARDALVEQMVQQLNDSRAQNRRMVELQAQVMSENERLHGSAQAAGSELERTSRVVRDLEHANQVLRDENQAQADHARALLDAIAGLREELRASFRGQEAAAAQVAAERREWREAQRALEAETDDLRRRLRWLEDGHAGRAQPPRPELPRAGSAAGR